MKNAKLEDLSLMQKNLLNEASKAMENAYNPYSNFYVGCAILSQEGRIITASNVENAAYGSCICAERGAIMRANAMGMRMFDSVAIIARGRSFDTLDVVSPCGSCRQMLYESSQISDEDLEIIMSNTKMDKIVVATISELLPLAFGPKDLGMDISDYRK